MQFDYLKQLLLKDCGTYCIHLWNDVNYQPHNLVGYIIMCFSPIKLCPKHSMNFTSIMNFCLKTVVSKWQEAKIIINFVLLVYIWNISSTLLALKVVVFVFLNLLSMLNHLTKFCTTTNYRTHQVYTEIHIRHHNHYINFLSQFCGWYWFKTSHIIIKMMHTRIIT